MTTSLVLFYLLGALCLGGALGVVVTRNVVYAALALLVSLMAVAGLYLLVFAHFLSLVQVFIYGGAIIIVVLFAVMLTRVEDFQARATNTQWPLAAIAAMAIFGILAAALLRGSADAEKVKSVVLYELADGVGKVKSVEFLELAETLFTQWAVPFEVASLVLRVALIGAIVLARGVGGRE